MIDFPLCVCLYVCLCICLYVLMSVCVHVQKSICAYVYTHAHTYMCTFACRVQRQMVSSSICVLICYLVVFEDRVSLIDPELGAC